MLLIVRIPLNDFDQIESRDVFNPHAHLSIIKQSINFSMSVTFRD